jgi:hypothetical protein
MYGTICRKRKDEKFHDTFSLIIETEREELSLPLPSEKLSKGKLCLIHRWRTVWRERWRISRPTSNECRKCLPR